ncbi:putative ABC transport system permease protein [Novosphingobium kunmingense]|uniref:Putative ABC transport system permease protein n=1 Tax=Novosphingobium kunmingense TaxID=1211806 RepID=A0A2N0HKX6_9SPHN|nr:FtsX-like permease family protein [Novosphingobium kunmingense]PKB19613.1 putative ABC transport system permease protein [Novosphingobium kunmingense]
MSERLSWSAAWTIARRDLSARFKGLRLLLVCLFLGVGALAAIGTLTGAIERELASRGRTILGGDIELSVWQRSPTAAEQAAFARAGTASTGLRMQAMATAGDLAAPVELKAVDDRWPLVGRLTLTDGRKVGAPAPGSAWIAPGAAERLGVAPGGTINVGGRPLRVAGIVADEPDRLGEGFTLGPVVITAAGFPAESGLTSPGAMYRSKTRIALPAAANPVEVGEAIKRQFPSAGLDLRTRDKASPGAERFVTRMGDFLVLVGLAALVIAGIGIGGGVSSYLEARRGSIATLKVLGATSGDIARIYLMQIGAAALVGSAAGLVGGVLVTPLLDVALGSLLPVAPGFVLDPLALAKATLYGLLVALIFAAPPLLAARRFPAMALMRARVSPLASRWRDAALPVGLGMAAIAGLALATASQKLVTLYFLAGSVALLGLLALLGWAIRRTARRLPRPERPLLRIALANLHRPGAQTGALVTALGFGLSAFVTLAAIQTSLDANIAARVPQRAPDYFVLDVPRDRADAFKATIAGEAPRADVRMVPSLRGAILAYGPADRMTRVADLPAIPDEAWPLRGERGLTYSDTVPEGNTVTAGAWWPVGYTGEPLVSIDEDLATALDLKIGDKLTIGLLGVERTARIASLRRIDWDSMGFNYVLVFSPNAIADAPHNLAATIDLPQGSDRGPLLRAMVRAFPSSSVIEIGGVLTQARELLSQVSLAILAAASVAVLAGIAVLLGAIAAARASRTYDNVILRVLGASRQQLLALQLAEYGLLATVLAGVALALGSGLAWLVVVQLFEFDWLPSWPHVLAVLGAGLVLVIGFALAASLPLLKAKPARALREL